MFELQQGLVGGAVVFNGSSASPSQNEELRRGRKHAARKQGNSCTCCQTRICTRGKEYKTQEPCLSNKPPGSNWLPKKGTGVGETPVRVALSPSRCNNVARWLLLIHEASVDLDAFFSFRSDLTLVYWPGR